MKKTLLSILTVVTLTSTASLNITSTDVKWIVGNTWTMNTTSGVSIGDFTNTGTEASWDLTSYAGSSSVDTVKILNKTAGTNSTIKIQSDIIAGANYEPLTGDWGMETGEALGTEFVFLSGSHALGFPHSQGDTWSSASTITNLFPPYSPHATNFTGSVIASGQIITNYGTFDALLVEENLSVPGYSIDETYYYWETKEYGRIATLIEGELSVMKNNNFSPVTTVSKNTVNRNNLQIFPNPSNGNFTISSNDLDNVKVFNALGILVFNETVSNNSINVSTSNLKSGIYFVQVTENGNFSTSRIIVK
jgi:hypothetical protein